MAIKLDCPRCKRPLSVPRKKAGRYVNCPRCGGRFWVPENAADATPEGHEDPPVEWLAAVPEPPPTMSGSSPAVPAPPATPRTDDSLAGTDDPSATVSMDSLATVPPGGVVAQAPGGQNSPAAEPRGAASQRDGGRSAWQVVARPASSPSLPPATRQPESAHKTARFVSAQAAQSTLKLAEDGKLPDLHLREGEQKAKKEAQTLTVNPLVLFGLLAISVALTIGLVLVDVGPPESQKKDQAREVIRTEFFRSLDEEEPLQPYQLDLREAQRAHTQGDHEREQSLYQQVLDRLRQEPVVGNKENRSMWLTGSRDRDKRLQQQISILLGED